MSVFVNSGSVLWVLFLVGEGEKTGSMNVDDADDGDENDDSVWVS